MKYFGTDGFRGEANETLNVTHAFQIGRYLGWHYGTRQQKRAKVVIGKDTRRSSYMFENALAAGLTASGADVFLLHVTTTPSVSYVVRTEGFDCGIMISASHNPFFDNGIKIIEENGAKMAEEVLEKIEAYIDGKIEELPLAKREEIGRSVDHSVGRNRYVGYLISTAMRSYKDKRIGLDCANGAAFSIAKNVFDALGARTYVINDQPDGLNINVDSGSTHIEYLQDFVVKNRLDAGFAFDGDADRCIAVDEKGEVIDGDAILYICGSFLKETGGLLNDTIVTTVMSNMGLYKALDKLGIRTEKTNVGDKYVYQNMVENGHCLGGEQSGHIIFSKYASTGDGILTALRMMDVMLEKKQPFSVLRKDLKIYPQLLENVKVSDKISAQKDAGVCEAIARAERELGERGRILVRESGTESLVRVMVEAETDDLCKEYVGLVVKALRESGYAIS